MKDVQNEGDDRGLDIHKVGIKGLKLPVYLKDRDSVGAQPCVATFNVYSSLPEGLKGVHMSHFASILQKECSGSTISLYSLLEVKIQIQQSQMKEMKGGVDVKVHLEAEFDYFVQKSAPRTHERSCLPVHCKFVVSDNHDSIVEARVPVTTLCPCSKEMSDKGAHNQRSFITIAVQSNDWIWIEELIELAETSASCPIYPVLRRTDEKAVVDYAYNNPKFVEDVIRDLELKVREDKRIAWYRLYVENEESIHCHNAYAEKEGGNFQ